MFTALRNAALSDAAAVVYCSLSRPYASAMLRSPVMRKAPKRSHERWSASRNSTMEESSETNFSVGGETFIMSRSGEKETVGLLVPSNTWENARGARYRLVWIISESVEVGSSCENSSGVLRSSIGTASREATSVRPLRTHSAIVVSLHSASASSTAIKRLLLDPSPTNGRSISPV